MGLSLTPVSSRDWKCWRLLELTSDSSWGLTLAWTLCLWLPHIVTSYALSLALHWPGYKTQFLDWFLLIEKHPWIPGIWQLLKARLKIEGSWWNYPIPWLPVLCPILPLLTPTPRIAVGTPNSSLPVMWLLPANACIKLLQDVLKEKHPASLEDSWSCIEQNHFSNL